MSYRIAALRTVAKIGTSAARKLQSASENPTSGLRKTIKAISHIGGKKKMRAIQAQRRQNSVNRWKRQAAASESAMKARISANPKNKANYQSQAARTKFRLAQQAHSYSQSLKRY